MRVFLFSLVCWENGEYKNNSNFKGLIKNNTPKTHLYPRYMIEYYDLKPCYHLNDPNAPKFKFQKIVLKVQICVQ